VRTRVPSPREPGPLDAFLIQPREVAVEARAAFPHRVVAEARGAAGERHALVRGDRCRRAGRARSAAPAPSRRRTPTSPTADARVGAATGVRASSALPEPEPDDPHGPVPAAGLRSRRASRAPSSPRRAGPRRAPGRPRSSAAPVPRIASPVVPRPVDRDHSPDRVERLGLRELDQLRDRTLVLASAPSFFAASRRFSFHVVLSMPFGCVSIRVISAGTSCVSARAGGGGASSRRDFGPRRRASRLISDPEAHDAVCLLGWSGRALHGEAVAARRHTMQSTNELLRDRPSSVSILFIAVGPVERVLAAYAVMTPQSRGASTRPRAWPRRSADTSDRRLPTSTERAYART